jgi:predicted site-specific integrase-resolvase
MSDREPGLPSLLSSAEVQALFGRSARTVRRWVRHGRLTPLRLGGAVFFRESDLRRLIEGELQAALAPGSAAREAR